MLDWEKKISKFNDMSVNVKCSQERGQNLEVRNGASRRCITALRGCITALHHCAAGCPALGLSQPDEGQGWQSYNELIKEW